LIVQSRKYSLACWSRQVIAEIGLERFGEGWERVGENWERVGEGWERVGEDWERIGEGWERVVEDWEHVGDDIELHGIRREACWNIQGIQEACY
jgi:hypothetical protein